MKNNEKTTVIVNQLLLFLENWIWCIFGLTDFGAKRSVWLVEWCYYNLFQTIDATITNWY